MRFSYILLLFSLGALACTHAKTNGNATTSFTRRDMSNSQGVGSDGFFHSLWSSSSSGIDYTDGTQGSYYVKWSCQGTQDNFVVGKGYAKGGAQSITYSAEYQPQGNSYLSIYGWSKTPLREYYILESFGSYDPSSKDLEYRGSLTSDGSVYKIYESTRENKPSIVGTATFQQYWSIRQDKRTAGTVTVANHFNAWAKLGMTLGEHDYQIVATEGYGSSGESSVRIHKTYSSKERMRYLRWYHKSHKHH